MKTRLFATLLAVVAAHSASAQFAPEHTGFVGTVDLGATHVAIGAAPYAWRGLWGARVGHRWSVTNSVRFGVLTALRSTNLRGMKVGRDPYAFFVGDVGPELTLRAHERLRLTARALTGIRSAESLEGSQVWNYNGSGKSFGVGAEIPMTGEGRGLVVEVNRVSGTFTKKERLKVLLPMDAPVKGWTLTVGWGGPMHIGPFWK